MSEESPHHGLPVGIEDALTYEVCQMHQLSKKDANELVFSTLQEVQKPQPLESLIADIRTRLELVASDPSSKGSMSVPPFLLKSEHRRSRTVLSAEDMSFGIGGRKIIHNVSLDINSKDKVAIIGLNGSGKTTLIKLLIGEIEPDSGTVRQRKNTTFAYLPQSNTLSEEQKQKLVIEEIREAPADFVALRDRIHALERGVAEAEDSTATPLGVELAARLDEYHKKGGYQIEGAHEPLLLSFGFQPDHFYRPLSTLSGGELTKLLLAKIVLERPDVLILDEPTNNLDIEGIRWLERFLQSWQKGILCVSHEREFINRVFNRIVEMEHGSVNSYKGNYNKFASQKDLLFEQRMTHYERQQEEIDRLMRTYRRLLKKSSTKGKATPYKAKAERLMEHAIEKPTRAKQVRRLSIGAPERSPNLTCRCKNLTIGYDKPLLSLPTNLEIYNGQSIGIVGRNGIGKTTLLRTIVGETPPVDGEVHLPANIEVGYMSQSGALLDTGKTAVDEVMSKTGCSYQEARNVLGALVFPPNSTEIPIDKLSGGERSKVSLAILMKQKPSFLVLDEPTTHLDIPSKEALEEAIIDYEGSLLIVSHDRYLLRELCETVWSFDAEGFRATSTQKL